MNEDRLKALLREEPLPGAAEAERRGLAMVNQAYAERRAAAARPVLPRLAVALAAITLLAALLLTPAGAAVRDWIGDVFTAGVRNAEPSLTEIPGGGKLLVQSARGPWVVQADGSRRLLGDYAEASWSPHGLFVATASGRTLSAIEPDGTPHWSVPARARVSDPRWSPSGFRIAYRAGRTLRVVRADGTRDRVVRADGTRDAAIGPASAAVAPAWFPPGLHLLAYVDAKQRLVVAEADSGRTVDSAKAAPGVTGLSWSRNGGEILEIARRGAWARDVRVNKLGDGLRLGPARRLPLPAGTAVRAAAYSPRGDELAILLERPSKTGAPRSEALLLNPAGGPARRLFGVSGRLTELAWSPDGRRLLLAWPAAGQWLFVPTARGTRLRAIGNVAGVFSPGTAGKALFPRIEGWCC
jgi:dipeptidyl aminopeptidase/acylaminoacyl peptidase